MRRLRGLPRLLLFAAALLWLPVSHSFFESGQGEKLTRCPYQVLKIKSTASLQTVRAAYRNRARETHPDKNPGDEERAAKRFLEVVSAFELLSDDDERRRYDSTGDFEHASRPKMQRPQGRAKRVLTASQKRAQRRCIKVKSRQHLEDLALGEERRVDRHFVLALYDPSCEDELDFDAVFPFPFADKLELHGIWWEDVLQTAKARLRDDSGQASRIARRFGAFNDKNLDLHCPSIVFARNGSSLWDDFDVLTKPTARTFEPWIWSKLETKVHFVNFHDHTVNVFWIRGGESHQPLTLAPGESAELTAWVSHLFAVRDIRAGGPLAPDATLAWKHVDSDSNPFLFEIHSKCVDWSGDCELWRDQGECRNNPDFMRKFCHVTCTKTVAKALFGRAAKATAAAIEARRLADEAARHAAMLEAAARLLEEDATAAEIVAEGRAAQATACAPAYPERVVREW